MRLEIVPLIIGVIIALVGIALIFDAWTPDAVIVRRERRRRQRLERSRVGETLIGLGVIGMGVAFIGRDTWQYSVVVVGLSTVLLVVGVVLNWRFFGSSISNRGSLRRREDGSDAGSVAPARAAAPHNEPGREPPVGETVREPVRDSAPTRPKL